MYVLCVSLSVLLKGCGLSRVSSFSALFLLQTLRNEAVEEEETFREGREGTLKEYYIYRKRRKNERRN